MSFAKNEFLAASRAAALRARQSKIAVRWGITLEQYLNLTVPQKLTMRAKFPLGRKYKHSAAKYKSNAQEPASEPVDERAEAMELAMLASRAEISEEDYKIWRTGVGVGFKYRDRYGGNKNKVVQWTQGEAEIIAGHAAEKLLAQGISFIPEVGDRSGLGFLMNALQEGIQHLPRDRRKALKTRQSIRERLTKALRSALRAEGKKIKTAIIPPAPVKPSQTSGEVIHLPGSAPAQPEQVIDHEEPAHYPLRDVSNEALLTTLLSRLFKALERTNQPQLSADPRVAQLEQQVKAQKEYQDMLMDDMRELRVRVEQLQGPQLHFPSEIIPVEPEVRALRVAVLGCLGNQFEDLKRAVGALNLRTKLEFERYDTDQNPRPFSADYCLMFKWLTHHWEAAARRAVPQRERRAFMKGGITSAALQVGLWFNAEPGQAQG